MIRRNVLFMLLLGLFGHCLARPAAAQPSPIKSEPMALATGVEATNVPVLTPEASAYGSRHIAFLSGHAQPVPQEDPQEILQEDNRDEVLTRRYDKALLIDLDGPIMSEFHWYLNDRLDRAEKQGVDLVLLRLTSPGGRLDHSVQLARRLRNIDWATTVVFIPEEAISGGAIVALGCDRIYMRRGALIGDAGPVALGMDGQFQHAEEKVVSYLSEAIRELAAAHDRPAALAEAMVDRSLIVYEATAKESGETVYLNQTQVDAADVQQRFDVGPQVPETGQNRFLTVSAERALELQLCEGVYPSEQALLQEFDVALVNSTRLTWVDQTVYRLNRPWFTALLLVVGLIGLYLELTAPGISVAGLTALCCFSLFFWSHVLGGTAGWLEVLLFFLGIICLVIELFVLPGFGVFGISGLGLLVVSLVMASQDFVIPDTRADWNQLQTNLLIVLGAVAGVMVLFFAQIMILDTVPGLNRFRLAAPQANADEPSSALVGLTRGEAQSLRSQAMVGEQGVAESDLRPSGKIKIGDRLWDVVTEGDYIEAGTDVEVRRVEGNRIVVRRA